MLIFTYILKNALIYLTFKILWDKWLRVFERIVYAVGEDFKDWFMFIDR